MSLRSPQIIDEPVEALPPAPAHTDRPAASDRLGSSEFGIYGAALWHEKRRLLIGLFIGIVLGVGMLHFAPKEYTTSMVVRPPDDRAGAGGLAAKLGGLGGLVGMAGLLGGGGQSDFEQFNKLLTSSTLARYIVANHPEALRIAFAGRWDDETQDWRQGGLLAPVRAAIKDFLGLPPWAPPDAEDLQKFLSKELKTDTDFRSGMVTLSYSDRDPQAAVEFLSLVHRSTDHLVREAVRESSNQRIAYITKELGTTQQLDLRQAMLQILTSEQQRQTLVQADEFFAAPIVDRPAVPRNPSSPSIPVFILTYGLLGAGIAAARIVWRTRRAMKRQAAIPAYHPPQGI